MDLEVLIMYRMIKSNQIRNHNRIIIEKVSKSSVSKVFSAYIPGGHQIDINIKSDSAWGSVGAISKVLRTGLSLIGKTGFIDIERKPLFMSTDPIKFQVDCYLIMETDYDKDIKEKFNTLIGLVLPSRNTGTSEEVGAVIDQFTDESNVSLTKYLGSGICEALKEGVESIKNYIGKVYTLELPEALKTDFNMRVTIGNKVYKECIINSISVTYPKIYYVDSNGNAVFDHIKLTLGIETLRCATVDMIRL